MKTKAISPNVYAFVNNDGSINDEFRIHRERLFGKKNYLYTVFTFIKNKGVDAVSDPQPSLQKAINNFMQKRFNNIPTI